MKPFLILIVLVPCLLTSCVGKKLTTAKVQTAVDSALDWTKKGGRAEVTGVREVSQDNSAVADIRFIDFQYNSDQAGTPISKTQEAPRQPNINDPNYYDQVFKYGTQQVRVRSYTGAGTATLQHYSDGRWVLTNVQFNFVGVNASVEVR